MESTIVTRTTSRFPESILVKILSRLPVKSLLRFKCVEKLWYNLITRPEFVSVHLNNYASAYLVIENIYRDIHSYIVSRISLTTKTTLSMNVEFSWPTQVSEHEFQFQSTCNGIVCLQNIKDEIALWNPATRALRVLPPSNINCDSGCCADVGFGFDLKTNDYKVLQMAISDDDELNVYVQFKLYSLRTKSWKELEPTCQVGTNSDRAGDRAATYLSLNGKSTLCWITAGEWGFEIVTFDLSDEKFEIIELPPQLASLEADHYGMLFPFRESIALTIRRYERGNPTITFYDVWVNEDVFNFDSWTKLQTLIVDDGLELLGRTLYPLGFLGNGQLIFHSERKTVTRSKSGRKIINDPESVTVHDIFKDKKIEYVVGTGVSEQSKAFLLQESLVAISN